MCETETGAELRGKNVPSVDCMNGLTPHAAVGAAALGRAAADASR